MIRLPEYKLVGGPYKLACHHKPSRNYYQAYKLPPSQKVLKAPCCADKQQSERKAIKYVEDHIRKNLRDPAAIYANTPISEHLKIYAESLNADHCNPKYIKMVLYRIKRVCKAQKWRLVSDIDGLALKNWVAKQKWAMKTAKDYVAACKAFTHFLFLHNRAEADPLARTTLAVKGDLLKRTTRKRRCITLEEFQRLLVAAASGPETHGLTGDQRKMLYLLTAATGFRAQECASITPRSFNLDDQPTVVIDCTISKRRRHDCQELQADVADEFRRWLIGKNPDEPLWPGWWWSHGSDMLQIDLAAAGVDFKTAEGVVDFHAVGRVQFVTRVMGTSCPVALALRIARLSTPALLERYYKPSDSARSEVIAALPSLLAE